MAVSVYFVVAVASAAAIGLAARLAGFRWREAAGVGLVAWPLARVAVNVGASWGSLFTFEVLRPIPAEVLWETAGRTVWHNVAIPLLGLTLVTGSLRGALGFSRVAPRESWARDALNGLALVPLVAGGYVLALAVLVSGFASGLVDGDESRVFAEMTPLLAIVVSLAAGLAEEFVYRGVLLSLFSRLMPVWVAAFVQAVVFGFAHVGYGTWAHVLGPLVFGLFMAWVTLRIGLLPAVVLHAAIDVVFFGLDIAQRDVAGWWMLAGLAVVSLGAIAVVRTSPVRAMLSREAT